MALVRMRRKPPPLPYMNPRGTDLESVGRGQSPESIFWRGEQLSNEYGRGQIGQPPADPTDPECVKANAAGLAAGLKPSPIARLDDGLAAKAARHRAMNQPRDSEGTFTSANPEPEPKKRGSKYTLSEAMKLAKERLREDREI